MNTASPQVPRWAKHLIECNCILPQFRSTEFIKANGGKVPFHKFVVFSELKSDTGAVKTSYAQCNNCNAIHKIIEINKSEVLKREEMRTLPDIDELKHQVPEGMEVLLKRNDCPLHTWQQAEFIFRNKLWGEILILSRERENPNQNQGKWITKYVLILGDNLWKIYTDTEDDLEGFYLSEDP